MEWEHFRLVLTGYERNYGRRKKKRIVDFFDTEGEVKLKKRAVRWKAWSKRGAEKVGFKVTLSLQYRTVSLYSHTSQVEVCLWASCCLGIFVRVTWLNGTLLAAELEKWLGFCATAEEMAVEEAAEYFSVSTNIVIGKGSGNVCGFK